jgi:hypothetical protein
MWKSRVNTNGESPGIATQKTIFLMILKYPSWWHAPSPGWSWDRQSWNLDSQYKHQRNPVLASEFRQQRDSMRFGETNGFRWYPTPTREGVQRMGLVPCNFPADDTKHSRQYESEREGLKEENEISAVAVDISVYTVRYCIKWKILF